MLFRSLNDNLLARLKKRLAFGVIFAMIFFICLALRLYYLQVQMYEKYARLSDSNRIRLNKVPAERGFILDRNGLILVRNAASYELSIVKEDTKNLNALLSDINNIVPFNMKLARQKIKKSYFYQPTVILRGLSFQQVAYFLEHSADFPGVEVDLKSVRSYFDGESLSHIIGYTGEVSETDVSTDGRYAVGDIIGKSGIEKEYDSVLRGTDGARQVEVDSFGRVFEIIHEKEALSGHNVILTIDYELQRYIADTLYGRRGAVLVLDARDNSVLAMYSAPSYDLNDFTPFVTADNWQKLLQHPLKPLLNRNIEGTYPPGSIYKIIMAIAGLKEGVVTPETKFRCTGTYKLNENFSYECWRKGGHGEMNLVRALAASCDVYFYNLGRLLEIDKIQEYSNIFSLGRLTGIDLPNEKSGFFPSREWKIRTKNEVWFPGETIITSIGQGYMVSTPLQMGVMMSGAFNGGKIYKPRIVAGYESNETELVTYAESNLIRTMDIDNETSKLVMEGLINAVYSSEGTSKRASVAEVRVGGKTGTAQVVSLKRTEDMKDEDIPEHWRDHSWFTGVFPAEEPKYVVVVMIEHGGGGGKSAAPVGGNIIKKMLERGYK